MKKLLMLSPVIAVVLLCSFVLQQKGIKKIGTNLYTVTSTEKMSAADKEALKKIIVDHYGIKDYATKTVEIAPNDPRSLGNWIFHKSAVLHVISESLIKYNKSKLAMTPEAKKINAILSKYAAM